MTRDLLLSLLNSEAFTSRRRASQSFRIRSGIVVAPSRRRPGLEIGTIVLRVDWENDEHAEWRYRLQPEGGLVLIEALFSWEA